MAALVAAEQSIPFNNPMLSSLADLSVFHDPSRSEGSDPIHKPEASTRTVDANSDAGQATDTEERGAVTRTRRKPGRNTRHVRTAPTVRKPKRTALFHDTSSQQLHPPSGCLAVSGEIIYSTLSPYGPGKCLRPLNTAHIYLLYLQYYFTPLT